MVRQNLDDASNYVENERTKKEVVNSIGTYDVSWKFGCKTARTRLEDAHLTSPSSSILLRVSCVSGVDASTQTPPCRNLIAVDLPPIGNIPSRAKGLSSRREILAGARIWIRSLTWRRSRHLLQPTEQLNKNAVCVQVGFRQPTSRMTTSLMVVQVQSDVSRHDSDSAWGWHQPGQHLKLKRELQII